MNMSNRLIKPLALTVLIALGSAACDQSSKVHREQSQDFEPGEQSSTSSVDESEGTELRPRVEKETPTQSADNAESVVGKIDDGKAGEDFDDTVAVNESSRRDDIEIVVGDARVPSEWFDKASDHVRKQIRDWAFTLKSIEGKNVIGVVDENGNFVTWPGAKVFAEGEYPEGYIFIGFDDDTGEGASGDGVRF
ncbi:MAG: hypothetical protein B9S35_15025 [Opitutia bacterium Tous-C5TDCM]|jgi:hypothetical protein|nr:MAG: hypothetical protein B9S35_15025 [Opitutae bacterium Tous-C5TDCM]